MTAPAIPLSPSIPWQQPRTLAQLRRLSATPVWLDELADRFESLIKAPNNGEWPATRKQCFKIAAAVEFDRILEFRSETPLPGFEDGRSICVLDTGDDLTDLPRAVHELVEAASRNGLVPPFTVPDEWIGIYGDLLHHELARIVQARHWEWLLFVQAARAWAAEKRRLQRQRKTYDHPTLDLSYERDEYSEPDFGNESWRIPRRKRGIK